MLHHREFLAVGDQDLRWQFTGTLIAALDAFAGPVVVYSAYEQTRLRDLAGRFPKLRAPLEVIIGCLADLLPVVRGAVYLPAFGFSNSIKSVAPALCRGFGYDDLDDVADGGAASRAFVRLASGHGAQMEVDRLRAALQAYCRSDTLAMVEVHRALEHLAKWST